MGFLAKSARHVFKQSFAGLTHNKARPTRGSHNRWQPRAGFSLPVGEAPCATVGSTSRFARRALRISSGHLGPDKVSNLSHEVADLRVRPLGRNFHATSARSGVTRASERVICGVFWSL
jgi:hypothetical protein